MIPGDPSKLTCPRCGGHKHILTLRSGNTFDATVWSDTKHEYPMLPSPSVVQHCPHCGGYYFYEDSNPTDVPHPDNDELETMKKKGKAEKKKAKELLAVWEAASDESHRNWFGELSFEQADAAYDMLFPEDLSDEKRDELLFLWLFAFNDQYGGRSDKSAENVCTPELVAKHSAILHHIIERNERNDLFKAELYRELGDFVKCIELASGLLEEDSISEIVARQIINQAEIANTKVFPIVFPADI